MGDVSLEQRILAHPELGRIPDAAVAIDLGIRSRFRVAEARKRAGIANPVEVQERAVMDDPGFRTDSLRVLSERHGLPYERIKNLRVEADGRRNAELLYKWRR